MLFYAGRTTAGAVWCVIRGYVGSITSRRVFGFSPRVARGGVWCAELVWVLASCVIVRGAGGRACDQVRVAIPSAQHDCGRADRDGGVQGFCHHVRPCAPPLALMLHVLIYYCAHDRTGRVGG